MRVRKVCRNDWEPNRRVHSSRVSDRPQPTSLCHGLRRSRNILPFNGKRRIRPCIPTEIFPHGLHWSFRRPTNESTSSDYPATTPATLSAATPYGPFSSGMNRGENRDGSGREIRGKFGTGAIFGVRRVKSGMAADSRSSVCTDRVGFPVPGDMRV